jgi:peptidase MA superfamily protein/tetratricopeptide repeat protein
VNKALKSARLGLFAGLPVLAFCAGLHADTIYLKNGRQIQGTNVTTKNGKVSFETPAGTMSLSESVVDRIVKGDPPIGPQGNSNSPASNLAMAPPDASDAGPLLQSVLRNGAIDQDVLAQIDARAASRSPDALARAADAESAASRFEMARNNLGPALQHAERALGFAPDQVPLLLTAAYLHLRRSEFQSALDLLENARRHAPDSAEVAKLMGWADYGLNRLPQAVEELKRSQQLHPDPEVARSLEKAQRDLDVNNSFREGRSAHFDLHYYGDAAPELARDVLRVLEHDFGDISAALNYTPNEPISVTLYTNQLFQDITRAPSWAGALNDGRIRVPVQGLDRVSPELARVLRHELTHSFINEKTHGRCPTWLQEGAAQWMEGTRLDSIAAGHLLAIYDRHQEPSLSVLEPFWNNLPSYLAAVAYAWSLAVVENIETTSPGDLERILDRLDEGASGENAVRAALHSSYADLNAATADYLRKIH